jgi:hypothetical protein
MVVSMVATLRRSVTRPNAVPNHRQDRSENVEASDLMADPPRLNSLERFRKQPGRLVLEEHSHCEVPAGCGGVVMRWRNPLAGQPLVVHFYTPVTSAKLFLDGAEPQTARVDLPPGWHVAAIVIEDVKLYFGLLMLAAVHDPSRYQRTPPTDLREEPVKVVTADDGTWKFSLHPPPDDWSSLAFDDRDWLALTTAPTPQVEWNEHGAYQCHHCTDQGAACLGLPIPAGEEERRAWWRDVMKLRVSENLEWAKGTVWVRKVLEVPAPQAAT